jgi:glutathione S-transferase
MQTNKKIKVYQGPEVWGTPNASPFCTKLLCFLNASKIPYEVKEFNPMKAPKGKMPYIEYDGRYFGDSQLIMSFLSQEFSVDLDAPLTEHQKSISHSCRRMLEEGTYFLILWSRWGIDENWSVIRKAYFANMPAPMKYFLPEILRRSVKRSAMGQGTARHTFDELEKILDEDMYSLSQLMSKSGPYFHGETFTSIDCTVFAFLASLLSAPLPVPFGKKWKDHQQFQDYIQQVKSNFFPQ